MARDFAAKRMQRARIIGYATSVMKHESLHGHKLLLAVSVDGEGRPFGDPVLVLDTLGAGRGDTVLMTSDGAYTGGEILGTRKTPARWGVIGILDEIKK